MLASVLSLSTVILTLTSADRCMNDGIDYFAGPTPKGRCYGPVKFHAGRSTFWDSAEYCQSWYSNSSIPRFSFRQDPLTSHLQLGTQADREEFIAMTSLIDHVICNVTALKHASRHRSQICAKGESIYIDVGNRYDLMEKSLLGSNKCLRAVRAIPVHECTHQLSCWVFGQYYCDTLFKANAAPWVICAQQLSGYDVPKPESEFIPTSVENDDFERMIQVSLKHHQEGIPADPIIDLTGPIVEEPKDYTTSYVVTAVVLVLLISLLIIFALVLRYPTKVSSLMNMCGEINGGTVVVGTPREGEDRGVSESTVSKKVPQFRSMELTF